MHYIHINNYSVLYHRILLLIKKHNLILELVTETWALIMKTSY